MVTNIKKMMKIKDKRVVLLQSGGLDSCFLASLFYDMGYEIHHLFIDYGQNAKNQERKAVERIVEHYGGELHCVTLNMPWLQDSTLLAGHEVEDYEVPKKMGSVLAGTYVPMRNHVLLSIASSLAESLDIKYIASGIDGSENFLHQPQTGCPDKHPTFVKKFEKSITEGSTLKHMKHGKFILLTPLVGLVKEATIVFGHDILETRFDLSWTCYNDAEEPCGKCCACVDRAIHFRNVGLEDPALKN